MPNRKSCLCWLRQYQVNVIMSEQGGITARRVGHPNIFWMDDSPPIFCMVHVEPCQMIDFTTWYAKLALIWAEIFGRWRLLPDVSRTQIVGSRPNPNVLTFSHPEIRNSEKLPANPELFLMDKRQDSSSIRTLVLYLFLIPIYESLRRFTGTSAIE